MPFELRNVLSDLVPIDVSECSPNHIRPGFHSACGRAGLDSERRVPEAAVIVSLESDTVSVLPEVFARPLESPGKGFPIGIPVEMTKGIEYAIHRADRDAFGDLVLVTELSIGFVESAFSKSARDDAFEQGKDAVSNPDGEPEWFNCIGRCERMSMTAEVDRGLCFPEQLDPQVANQLRLFSREPRRVEP